jgi:hypothetical protein
MNVLDMEANMVPPLVTKLTLSLCVWPCRYARLARDHPHTYEPVASRAPPKTLASPAGLGRARLVAPHRQTSFAHLNPSRAGLASQTRTCMDTFTHTTTQTQNKRTQISMP